VSDVVYRNTEFESEFTGDPTKPTHPPHLPLPTTHNTHPSSPGDETDPPTSRVQEIQPIDHDRGEFFVTAVTPNGAKSYIRNHIPVDSNTSLDIYTDVTHTEKQEQYISVLQRVLRHNIRNDVNIIAGFAQEILRHDDLDPEIREYAERIARKAANLNSLSQSSTIIREVIGTDWPLHSIELDTRVRSVVSDIQDEYTATITYDSNPPHTILGTRHLPHLIRNLVENAVEHNTGEKRVHISIESPSPETTTLTVSDNGVGLPSTEKQVITGDCEITSLTHASSLGLWVIRWIADQHGATIEFQPSKMKGSTVRVKFRSDW
jgi:signal transduction histidine kinase